MFLVHSVTLILLDITSDALTLWCLNLIGCPEYSLDLIGCWKRFHSESSLAKDCPLFLSSSLVFVLPNAFPKDLRGVRAVPGGLSIVAVSKEFLGMKKKKKKLHTCFFCFFFVNCLCYAFYSTARKSHQLLQCRFCEINPPLSIPLTSL